MVPVDAEDPQAEYDELREELAAYSEELAARPHCLVLTKIDLLHQDDPLPELEAPDAWGRYAVSSVARKGVDDLLAALWERSREEEKAAEAAGEEDDEEWWTP